MPYPPGHREETRAKIIRSARKLFNRRGFDRVSIDAIMADAGLTRGAFYSYFDTKSDLYAEVLECFFTDPRWSNSWKGVHIIGRPPKSALKSFEPICLDSILGISIIRVP